MTFLYLTKILWLTPLLLQTAIVLAMLRRKLVTSFPLFFVYTIVVVCREFILLFLPKGRIYFLIYWWGETLAILLGLAVIFEILAHILPKSASLKFISNSVVIFAAVAAIAALLILVFANPSGQNDPLLAIMAMGERSVRFLQSSLLIFVIALMSRLGLRWRQESVGIAAGFGVYSALALACFELGAHLHVISDLALALVNSAAYNLAAMIWAFFILRPTRVTPIQHLPKADLPEWNSAVTDYVHQWSRRY
ncbi:MAG TPA: hypothetical protein VN517_06125 [Terriglobales bacterium]|jgi:hypothetical protein|nr:hypothetical protein [Terriglobales bacterium]